MARPPNPGLRVAAGTVTAETWISPPATLPRAWGGGATFQVPIQVEPDAAAPPPRTGVGVTAGVVQTRSSLHRRPHALPLRTGAHKDAPGPLYNHWARAFNVQVGDAVYLLRFLVQHKDGSTPSAWRPSALTLVDAPSQLVRPVASTAGPSDVQCPAHSSTFPPLRLQIAASIPIFPSELDRPELRARPITSFAWVTGHRATGAVTGELGQFDRFAIYDTAHHAQVRQLPRAWDLDHIVAEVLSIFPRVRSIRFLRDRLPGMPSVQVSVVMRDAPIGQTVLPLDFRAMEGGICTIRVMPGTAAESGRSAFETARIQGYPVSALHLLTAHVARCRCRLSLMTCLTTAVGFCQKPLFLRRMLMVLLPRMHLLMTILTTQWPLCKPLLCHFLCCLPSLSPCSHLRVPPC